METKHNYRICGKFAPKSYALHVSSIKRAYKRKLELMRDYIATFSCLDKELLQKENSELKSENKQLRKKCDDVCKINEQLRTKLRNFENENELTNLF